MPLPLFTGEASVYRSNQSYHGYGEAVAGGPLPGVYPQSCEWWCYPLMIPCSTVCALDILTGKDFGVCMNECLRHNGGEQTCNDCLTSDGGGTGGGAGGGLRVPPKALQEF